MHRHERQRQSTHVRSSIAVVAARLIAEDGISDYGLAKRKAARQLGLSDNVEFPDDAEIDIELKLYRDLYQDGEHAAHIRALRLAALDLLNLLEQFSPYLTGSVLDGTAGEYSSIDILLFADSAKEVEIFLLNQQIDVQHADPRNERVEAVLVVQTDIAEANLIILPPQLERVSFKRRDGRQQERVRAPVLKALLSE